MEEPFTFFYDFSIKQWPSFETIFSSRQQYVNRAKSAVDNSNSNSHIQNSVQCKRTVSKLASNAEATANAFAIPSRSLAKQNINITWLNCIWKCLSTKCEVNTGTKRICGLMRAVFRANRVATQYSQSEWLPIRGIPLPAMFNSMQTNRIQS